MTVCTICCSYLSYLTQRGALYLGAQIPSGPSAARVVEQSLAHILPDGMRPIEPDCIRFLNFDNTKAAHALNPQHAVGDFGEATLLDWQR